jgi:hypothetical protein
MHGASHISLCSSTASAGLHAAMNADRALAKGRLNSYRFWRGVIDALTEMGRTVPVVGERLN